jgi:hypothetical protein
MSVREQVIYATSRRVQMSRAALLKQHIRTPPGNILYPALYLAQSTLPRRMPIGAISVRASSHGLMVVWLELERVTIY